MSEFIFAANQSEVPENGMKLVEVDEQLVLILNVNNEFFCINDVCTHDGGTLCDGKLNGHSIACPRHGATFDVRTGAATKMPATQPTGVHDVKIEGDQILVRLKED
ncbi:non-heme iron oxygenase ferredoxin subunit [Pirellulaceae bacterium]|jgi:3-phenylpropionate/trans-cinnamate dioxygenase ferredoxin subunit|nr:non-heme iron oxygenase ferredoxin subunit [Pirellulaceae bacterium]